MINRTFIVIVVLCTLIFCLSSGSVKASFSYTSLDTSMPILFDGERVMFADKTYILGPKCFFVDGNLNDAQTSISPYVFNNLNIALDHIVAGTEDEPMVLLLAPYVYWIDNPDDPDIRKPILGAIPYGRVVKTDWLTFYGLNSEARNVVLACNRGQTMGAEGNFTMFYFDGDGIAFENVTLGNYCNVDLLFSLKPALNREKRSATIVQAQLAICNSDKVVARNTHFISRLNSCPMVGAIRAYFENCYFECTDDALCGTGVYYKSRFTFFSSKPFYSTRGTGAVFIDCDIDVKTRNRQYFVKVGTPVTLIDVRFNHDNDSLYVGWIQDAPNTLRCYSYGLTLNGKPLSLQPEKPVVSISLEGKSALDAFVVKQNSTIAYNLFNLLRGSDNWNPTEMKQLTNHLATRIFCTPAAEVESGVDHAVIEAQVRRFYDIPADEEIEWTVSEADAHLLRLIPLEKGKCRIEGTNDTDETRKVVVLAKTACGLEGACEVVVKPRFLDPPHFLSSAVLNYSNHSLKLNYELDLAGREDQSLITWYRVGEGTNNKPIAVKVSRLNHPEQVYALSREDVGYKIVAGIAPKHVRSHAGDEVFVYSSIIMEDMVREHNVETDFSTLPVYWQPNIIPGFWTLDSYKPIDTHDYQWDIHPERDSWYYGEGVDNAKGIGLLQALRGARLRYTPLGGNYGDMLLSINVSPAKSAGQGFGSATGQYMDICIKFDTQTLSGYGLRIIRTIKYDNAVDFYLIKYQQGQVEPISDVVSSTCYLTECTIVLESIGTQLQAKVVTSAPKPEKNNHLPHEFSLKASIDVNAYGGFAVQHTGSVGASATKFNWLRVDWGE